MQVRGYRQPAVARAADRLALGDVLADLDVNVAQMGEYGRKTVIVYDLNHPAHTAADVVAGVFDYTVGRGVDLGSDAGAKVHATVQTRSFHHRMFAHAETTGDGRIFQRISAGDGTQYQALLEGGMARDRDPLGNRQRRRGVYTDDGLELLQVVAERDQFRGPRFNLSLEYFLAYKQPFVFLLYHGIPVAQIGQIGVQFFNPSGKRVNHQEAAQEYRTDHAAGSQSGAAHELGKRIVPGAVAVGDRYLVVVPHVIDLFCDEIGSSS